MRQGMVFPLHAARASEKRFEILSQNLANISTPGYKAEVGRFETVLLDLIQGSEGTQGVGLDLKAPVQQFVGRTVDFSPGPIRRTGSELDVAILGEGFFAVETPDGVRYTRRGRFALNGEGQIVTSEGYPVQGTQGPINVFPAGELSIDSKGGVSVDGRPVGSLQVVTVPNTSLLERLPQGLFRWRGNPAELTEVEEPTVVQSSLEMSNVNPLAGMTQMINIMRAYEANMRLVSTMMETERRAASEIARIGI